MPSATEAPVAKARLSRKTMAAFGVAAAIGVESAAVLRKGYRPAGDVIVECRAGHRFTTLWIPGASLKAVRLGFVRFQRCPVGAHWSIVKPVRADSLSEEELAAARGVHDRRLP
ncbi:MAG: hypothetical protein M0004_03795 [Actinomycetota bacterium]|nr:hypothetical protein [Actinomycetota bacterium]